MASCLRPVLALDPSSTKTGYAVLLGERELACAGTLSPDKADDPPLKRIDAMCVEVWRLIDEYQPRAVVLEMPSGKVGGRHGGAGAGLSTYGVACGAMWRTCVLGTKGRRDTGTEVVTVDENTWTKSTKKSHRQRQVAAMFAAYAANMSKDKGGDCSDAIGLGLWYLAREKLAGQGTEALRH